MPGIVTKTAPSVSKLARALAEISANHAPGASIYLPHADLARSLNISDRALARAIRVLEDTGAISAKRGMFRVVCEDTLRDSAQGRAKPTPDALSAVPPWLRGVAAAAEVMPKASGAVWSIFIREAGVIIGESSSGGVPVFVCCGEHSASVSGAVQRAIESALLFFLRDVADGVNPDLPTPSSIKHMTIELSKLSRKIKTLSEIYRLIPVAE